VNRKLELALRDIEKDELKDGNEFVRFEKLLEDFNTAIGGWELWVEGALCYKNGCQIAKPQLLKAKDEVNGEGERSGNA